MDWLLFLMKKAGAAAKALKPLGEFLISPHGLLILLTLLLLSAFTAGFLKMKKGTGRKSFLFLKGTGRFFLSLTKILLTRGVKILITLFILCLLIALSLRLDRAVVLLEKWQRVQQLELFVANLKKDHKVMELEILHRDQSTIKAEITYFSMVHSKDGPREVHSEIISLPGTRLYFDFTVLNFEYAGIQEGKSSNIAIPGSVFSDRVPAGSSIPLQAVSEEGIPWNLIRNNENLYGIGESEYKAFMEEILHYTEDQEAAARAGIRNITWNALAESLTSGDRREIIVRNTGGVVIQEIW